VTSCDNKVCQFEGPVDPVDTVKRRRCLFRTSTTCTVDNDCPRDQSNHPTQCAYIYDSPISIKLQGGDDKLGACALTYLPVLGADHQPTIRGKLNLVSGELNLDKLAVLLVLNGTASNGRPDGNFKGVCPVCVGDTSPNDGRKDGTCQTSTVPDMPPGRSDPGISTDVKCDVNRYGEIPGYNFGYSMDCSPTLISDAGTPFGGSFSSSGYTVSTTDESPDCMDSNFSDPKFPGAKCLCGMCSDNKTACHSSSECPDKGPCVAASMPNSPTTDTRNVLAAGNSCDDQVCNWNEMENAGTCSKSGQTVGCYPFASKDRKASGVSITVPRHIRVDHGVYYADTASGLCTPAGTNGAVNKQVGLPGWTFQKRNFRIIPEYPEGQK
jgi:hypothetical protein